MIQTERVIASEALRFLRKDPSKVALTVGLYALTLRDAKAAKTLRASYFFARHLDDLLDGELISPHQPDTYAEGLIQQIATSKYDPDCRMARLIQYALPRLQAVALPEDNPKQEFITLINSLVFDYHRRQSRQTLPTSMLYSHYENTVNPSLNLLSTTLHGTLRAKDIPTYATNLSRLYSIRDLSKDWHLGIVNIPEHVLGEASLSTNAAFDQVVSNSVVRTWAQEELCAATDELQVVSKQLADMPPELPNRIISSMIKKAS
ncbi:MAG: phosphoesterase [Candidatus Saccharibacteria bacterium]|nr:phosphoesterase [Candidatus Saccharibacteria bacterium]